MLAGSTDAQQSVYNTPLGPTRSRLGTASRTRHLAGVVLALVLTWNFHSMCRVSRRSAFSENVTTGVYLRVS